MESTTVTGTHSSADWWDILLPLAYTPDRRDQRLLVSHPKDTGKDSPEISAYPRGGSHGMGGFRGSKTKSPGNVMNCPETNKKSVDPPHSGGRGSQGNWGGGAKFQKSGKCHELPRKSIHFCLSPPPYPTGGGGGVRSPNWRDGWEGLMGGREGCDGNYEVDPVHMAWNGCIILIGNPSVTS